MNLPPFQTNSTEPMTMSNELDAKAARERAKAIAEQRRAERRNRKRKCVV